MKKVLSLLAFSFLFLSLASYARTTYNPDNTIKYSNTIRTQREAKLEQSAERVKIHHAAAAAKLNYEELDKADTNKNNTDKK